MEANGLTRLSAQILGETFFLRCHVCVPSKIDRQYLAQEIYYELFGLVGRHLH